MTSAFLCASFNLPSAASMADFLSAGSLSPYSLSCFSVAKIFESAALILSMRSLLLLILRLVGLGLVAHTLDLLLGQTARRLDTDLLLLARTLVFRRYVQDAVGVDVERHFDLRHAARCGGDAVEVEAADRLVVARQRTFALADVDLHRRLVVGRRREDLALAGRDRRVGLDELASSRLPASRYPATAGSRRAAARPSPRPVSTPP